VEDGIAAHLEKHGKSGGNALRAGVLGASDGLLSNFNLVMGVAGANLAGKGILLTGVAGVLAGAISMGLGEWISVQSSRELLQERIRGEKDEIAEAPAREAAELVHIYQARGFDEDTSKTMATRMMRSPASALDAMTRDELGINPSRLSGSAWAAAGVSFLMFAIGAAIPVVPYTFLSGTTATVVSAGASAVGLFVIGGAITLFTGKSVLWSGLRQVAFGLVAATVVYLIGHLIGTRLGR
jgi:VIT1/CCC1 family predicted Fe2+/Mn2+ transporter